jgi:hypothetical protein
VKRRGRGVLDELGCGLGDHVRGAPVKTAMPADENVPVKKVIRFRASPRSYTAATKIVRYTEAVR